jgi:hypothetical protein
MIRETIIGGPIPYALIESNVTKLLEQEEER